VQPADVAIASVCIGISFSVCDIPSHWRLEKAGIEEMHSAPVGF
jgi:hypothetical protein